MMVDELLTSSPWSVQLSCFVHANSWVFWRILTSKVGHIVLVFGMQSGFISRSEHARLQVCVQWSQFVPSWLTFTQTDSILTSLYEKLSQLS